MTANRLGAQQHGEFREIEQPVGVPGGPVGVVAVDDPVDDMVRLGRLAAARRSSPLRPSYDPTRSGPTLGSDPSYVCLMLRLLGVGWLFHLKSLTNSTFFLLISVLQPVIFASIAFLMVENGNASGTLLYVALGAGLMGIWSSTLFGSGGAIQWQRWQGTLELLVAAPAPFVFCLLPLTVATSSIGALLDRGDAVLGRSFRDATRLRAHPLQLAPRSAGHGAHLDARSRAGGDVRARAACDRVLEPARVPGLARNGLLVR